MCRLHFNIIFIIIVFINFANATSSFILSASKTDTKLSIDGLLTESVWQEAQIAGDFIRYQPQSGSISTYRSEAMVLYDSTSIYIAFRLWDDETPTAQLTRRDEELMNDDAVVLILDTHNDRRSAYFFMTNLLGTQTDGRIADDGRTVDETWDAPWQSAAGLTDYGWSVEIAIPLTSVKYAAGDSVKWGVNFGRSRRRNLELSYWAGPLENEFRVSQAGVLAGLNLKPPTRRYQIIPYALTKFQEEHKTKFDIGGDIRYRVTPEMSVYATVNPDFATIEADQEQINLTRFELQLPEKRQFFLEGNELYQQRIRTFYSRRIPDIVVGGKVLGKAKSWTLAGLLSRSEELNDSSKATYSVARAQKDVLGSSNVAVMFANRTMEGIQQGSASMDATLFFSRTLGMTAQLVHSYGAEEEGNWGYFVRPAYDSPTGHFHVRYTDLGENFAENVNVIGFVGDDNRKELDSALEKLIWISKGPLERFGYDSNYNIYWGQNQVLRSWEIDQGIDFEFRNRFGFDLFLTEEFKRFEKDFRNREIGCEIGYNRREYQSVEVGYEFGKNFDSDFQLWTAEAHYKVTQQLAVEYELQRLQLDPDPEFESTWIHVARANQFFTKDLYLKLFFQTNSAIDRRNIQIVFVYRYQPPFGTIQVAYQRGTAEFGQASQQGNTLFLKVTTVF